VDHPIFDALKQRISAFCSARFVLVALLGQLSAIASVTVHTGANVPVPEAMFLAIDLDSVPFRRNLDLTMVPPTKRAEPVLRRGPKGSFDEIRAEYYGSVIRVDGNFSHVVLWLWLS